MSGEAKHTAGPEAVQGLIERLEKSGDDIRLNQDIGALIGFQRCTINGCDEVHEALNYTDSLQDALTLVPKGFHVKLFTGDPTTRHENLPTADVIPNLGDDDAWAVGPKVSRSWTLARAVCAAALRARSAP